MQTNNPKWLAAQRLWREGGWLAVARGAARYVGRRTGHCRRYYIFEQQVKERPEEMFRPRVDNLSVIMIRSNQEADALPASSDFRNFVPNARRALGHDALACCLFVDGKLAHISWVIFSYESKRCFDPIPYPVDFANGEACTGVAWTAPEFRGRGLATYSFCLRHNYIRPLGYIRIRCAIAVANNASLAVHRKFDPVIRACGWYVRLGRLSYWKEIPVSKSAVC